MSGAIIRRSSTGGQKRKRQSIDKEEVPARALDSRQGGGKGKRRSSAPTTPLLSQPQTPSTIRAQERDILLGRIEKELVIPLLNNESTKKAARSRLKYGINEVTKALEACVMDSMNSETDKNACACTHMYVVLVCGDVKPYTLVKHVVEMADQLGVPHVSLPNASRQLGALFGFKTMAVLGITAHTNTHKKAHTHTHTSTSAYTYERNEEDLGVATQVEEAIGSLAEFLASRATPT